MTMISSLKQSENGGGRISIIAIQCAEAVQCANRQVLTQHAAELLDISQKTWAEVEAMDVSPTMMQDKRDFQHVMVRMITAASSFKRGLPESDRELQEMADAISTAHDMLNTVRTTIGRKDFQQSGSHPAQGLYRFTVDTASEQEYAKGRLSQYELFPKPVGLLPIRTGYHYMDASQSNDIRIVPRYSRVVTQYYYMHPDTGKTVHVYAPEGKIYIMVHMRVAMPATAMEDATPSRHLHSQHSPFMDMALRSLQRVFRWPILLLVRCTGRIHFIEMNYTKDPSSLRCPS